MSDPDLLPPSPEPGPVIDHAPEPLPPPLPPPVPETRVERRGGTPVLLTLLLVAGLAGGLYWVWTNPRPQGAADQSALPQLSEQVEANKQALAPLPQQLQDLSGQVQALAARLQKIEQAPTPTPAAAPESGDAGKRLVDLATRLDALTAKEQADFQSAQQKPQDAAAPAPDHAALDALASQVKSDAQGQVAALGQHVDQALGEQKAGLEQGLTETKSTVDALGGRIKKLEQGAGTVLGEADKTAHALRVQQAALALAAGQPLGDIAGAPPALAAFAHKAPPTEAALRADFSRVAEAARVASRPEDDEKGFLGRALARVQQSVTVRRGDHVIVGDPAAGVLVRAQEDVANGDLGGAAEALSALHGAAGAAVADWVGQVRALTAARAALASLSARG